MYMPEKNSRGEGGGGGKDAEICTGQYDAVTVLYHP